MYQFLSNICTPLQSGSTNLYVSVLIIAMLLGFYLLTKGGDILSDHCSNLANSIGVPSVVVGLTIVSVATSAPELFTSISAITSDAQGLIIGNIVGSNIANIGLILGISLIISPINTKNAVSNKQGFVLLVLSLAFTIYLFLNPSKTLGHIPGSFLLLFIFLYLFLITKNALSERKVELSAEKPKLSHENSNTVAVSILMIVLATITLWLGSDTLVFGAKNLALMVGVPQELIGFTLVAIGTSLPELAASISLTKKKEFSMLLGNILGSNLFNIGLVGGAAGIMGPINVSTKYPWIDYLSLIILTTIFVFWLRGKKLAKLNGVILLTIYLITTIVTWYYNS